jgi:hypothetical protein
VSWWYERSKSIAERVGTKRSALRGVAGEPGEAAPPGLPGDAPPATALLILVGVPGGVRLRVARAAALSAANWGGSTKAGLSTLDSCAGVDIVLQTTGADGSERGAGELRVRCCGFLARLVLLESYWWGIDS